MNTRVLCVVVLAPILLTHTADLFAQNNAVKWSTFDMGFAIPASSNTKVKSAVGQSFIGTTKSVTNWIDSGFLADTLLRGPVTAVRGDAGTNIPSTYELNQNFPNPFNPSTNIRFALPRESAVKLVVYNILGQEVITLVDDLRPAGYYGIDWSGQNNEGRTVSSGVYFYRISVKDVAGQIPFSSLKKMILLR